MIYLQMSGRLGNQFFRYAVARAVQIKLYPNDKLVINYQQKENGDGSFYNALDDFNISEYEKYNKDVPVLIMETSILQKIVCAKYYLGMKKIRPEQMNEQTAYEKKWVDKLNNYGVYWFRRGGWELKKCRYKNKILSGNFENPQYFDDIRDVLIKEFTPKSPLEYKNEEIYDRIQKTNSICLSVRRGDFETNENIKNLHSVCGKDYFEKAIDIIKNEIDNPNFFMFSDDIEWVKENIKTGCPTYYEDGTDSLPEKIRLMSSCKHFIISNSTFSWWVQYLSTYDKKIVVSPKRWFNNDYKSPLINPEWILVDV